MGRAWGSARAQLKLEILEGLLELGFCRLNLFIGWVKPQAQASDLRLELGSCSEFGGSTHHYCLWQAKNHVKWNSHYASHSIDKQNCQKILHYAEIIYYRIAICKFLWTKKTRNKNLVCYKKLLYTSLTLIKEENFIKCGFIGFYLQKFILIFNTFLS